AADRHGVAPAVREPRVLSEQLDVGHDRPVVEPRVALEHDVRAAAGALEDADDLLARPYLARLVRPRVGMHRHEVRELQRTGIRVEGCLKDIRAGEVAPADGADTAWGELEVPALLPIEQASEHGGAVEAGPAAPVDRAGLRNERTGVHVAEETVIADGWIRFALRHLPYHTKTGVGAPASGGHRAFTLADMRVLLELLPDVQQRRHAFADGRC